MFSGKKGSLRKVLYKHRNNNKSNAQQEKQKITTPITEEVVSKLFIEKNSSMVEDPILGSMKIFINLTS